MVSCGVTLSEVGLSGFCKPQVGGSIPLASSIPFLDISGKLKNQFGLWGSVHKPRLLLFCYHKLGQLRISPRLSRTDPTAPGALSSTIDHKWKLTIQSWHGLIAPGHEQG